MYESNLQASFVRVRDYEYIKNKVEEVFKSDIREKMQEEIDQNKGNDNIHHKKIGRNDLCPCGSGKKYKKCHGR